LVLGVGWWWRVVAVVVAAGWGGCYCVNDGGDGGVGGWVAVCLCVWLAFAFFFSSRSGPEAAAQGRPARGLAVGAVSEEPGVCLARIERISLEVSGW
jgi:hypothetical protein